MKKRVLLLIVGLCVLMLAGGCSKKNDDVNEKDTDNTTEDSSNDTTDNDANANDDADTEVEAPTKGEYELNEYIKLGQYKDIEVTVEIAEATDEDVETSIDEILAAKPNLEEITDRDDVQDGDIANIDYEGLKDEVAFDGGTATNYNLTIGSGQFIPGFEEKLIGTKVGDKVEIELAFPEDYSQSPDLAGQDVVFKVTVNSILKENPELTLQYVTDNTDYDTIDAYKESIRSDIQKQNETNAASKKTNDVLAAIVENSEITYPQTLLDYYSAQIKNYYTEYASYFGMDFATFLTSSGITEEDFNNDAKEYAEAMTSQELVVKAIIEAEKMELSDSEFEEGVTKLAAEYGYPSSEEFLEIAAEDDIKETLLWQKVLDYVTAEAVEL